jgi:hypothetical protein
MLNGINTFKHSIFNPPKNSQNMKIWEVYARKLINKVTPAMNNRPESNILQTNKIESECENIFISVKRRRSK